LTWLPPDGSGCAAAPRSGSSRDATTNAIRTKAGGGWSIPARCDVALSVLSPNGVSLAEVGEDIERFLRELELEDGRFASSTR
jgi:hypothetical protein